MHVLQLAIQQAGAQDKWQADVPRRISVCFVSFPSGGGKAASWQLRTPFIPDSWLPLVASSLFLEGSSAKTCRWATTIIAILCSSPSLHHVKATYLSRAFLVVNWALLL